jgi:hypothetical protein
MKINIPGLFLYLACLKTFLFGQSRFYGWSLIRINHLSRQHRFGSQSPLIEQLNFEL